MMGVLMVKELKHNGIYWRILSRRKLPPHIKGGIRYRLKLRRVLQNDKLGKTKATATSWSNDGKRFYISDFKIGEN